MPLKIKAKNSGSSLGPNASVGSKLFASLFFAFFFGMGLFFAVMLVREVVLKKAGLAMLLFLLIPLVFVFIGGAGLYGAWFGKEKDKNRSPKTASYIRGKQTKNVGRIVGWLFLIIGGLVSYFMLVRPLTSVARARSWVETPCRILSARIETHDSDDGNTYSIEIEYEYTVDGAVYRGDRYNFLGGSSSGRKGKQAVVNRYREMESPVCYVNPHDPSESVLVRRLLPEYAFGLIPLVFVVVGAGILLASFRRRSTAGPDWLPALQATGTAQSFGEWPVSGSSQPIGSSVMLKPESTPFKKLLIALVFCLFWNGIVSVFLAQVVDGFSSGRPHWFLTIFLVPFVLVGLVSVGVVFYQFLALFNPRYTLTLEPARLVPGSVGRLRWQTDGLAGRIQTLTVQLVGTETATYRQGTDTKTDKHVFCSLDLLTTDSTMDIMAGQVDFAIPDPTMHSFNAQNNKIIWSFRLRGDIAHWPDVDQNHPFTVYPHTLSEVQS